MGQPTTLPHYPPYAYSLSAHSVSSSKSRKFSTTPTQLSGFNPPRNTTRDMAHPSKRPRLDTSPPQILTYPASDLGSELESVAPSHCASDVEITAQMLALLGQSQSHSQSTSQFPGQSSSDQTTPRSCEQTCPSISCGTPCSKPCEASDIVPCVYSDVYEAASCEGPCDGRICEEQDCSYNATCEWADDGRPCHIALPDQNALSYHVVQDHIQRQASMSPALIQPLTCGVSLPIDKIPDHLLQVHPAADDFFKCDVQNCEDKTAYSMRDLIDHVRLQHGEPPQCYWNDCSWITSDAGTLTQHVLKDHFTGIDPQNAIFPSTFPEYSQNIHDVPSISQTQPWVSHDGHTNTPWDVSQASLHSRQASTCGMSMSMGDNRASICQWTDPESSFICAMQFDNGNELHAHIEKAHLSAYKKKAKADSNVQLPMTCRWQGCKHFASGKVYDQLQHLKEHMIAHSKYRGVKCPKCARPFVDRKALEQHMRTHTGERPHVCDICGKEFGAKATLTTHKRSHTGEKPYECPICGHRDKDHANFKRHMAKHKPPEHHCALCAASFTKKANLTRHIKTKHAGCDPAEVSIQGVNPLSGTGTATGMSMMAMAPPPPPPIPVSI